MNLNKELPELLDAGVISKDVADRIQDYYENKQRLSTNRLFIVFGILGAILVGLGIILIVAHNWDELSRSVKTLFAFLPLLLGQALCGYALIRKSDSVAWRESAAAFLFFAVGASISLVSQIYNIPGNLSSFLLTWMLLCVPLIYVMRSSVVSLLYLTGITYYACETGYWSYPASETYSYWLLLLLALPHYFLLNRDKPQGNFTVFHHWLVPLSVIIVLGTVAVRTDELMFIAYFSLFGILQLLGERDFFRQQKTVNNAYRMLGSLGTLVMLLTVSFEWFWNDLIREGLYLMQVMAAPEFYASLILSGVAMVLLFLNLRDRPLRRCNPLSPIFLLFIVTFVLGLFSPAAVWLMNGAVLAIGILTIRDGAKHDHLGILNFGLLIITALVICRFFDTDLSFVIKGILFVSVGAGFFAMNYWILKTRKTND